MDYPIKWVHVSDEIEKKRRELYGEGSNMHNAVVSDPLGVHLPPAIKLVGQKVYNFELRPDDIWIITYPKCGTTWTQVLFNDGKICLSKMFEK